MFTDLHITLETENQEFVLNYKIHDSAWAQLWAKSVAHSLTQFSLHERNRFYHWDSDVERKKKSVVDDLLKILSQLRLQNPQLNFGKICFDHPREEVNRIHTYFVDNDKLHKGDSLEEKQLWADLNRELHHLESLLVSESSRDSAHFVVTFKDRELVPIAREAFENADLTYRFGHLYLQYSSVGRHILEIYDNQDVDVPAQHIQPFVFQSSYFLAWFGDSRDEKHSQRRLKNLKEWYDDHPEILKRAGLHWDPIALGLAHIPIADLCDNTWTQTQWRSTLSSARSVKTVEIF
jgi:hypothetical protein